MRLALPKGCINVKRLSTKVGGHGVRQPPRQDFARGPVHYRHQVSKALGHGDVRDVCTPDVVGSCNGTVTKQVGIDLVLKVRNRRSGLLVHRRDAHLAHQAFDSASGDGNALAIQLIPKAARPHVGMVHMQLVNPAHQVELFSRRARGQTIHTSSGQAQKLALGNHTQRMLVTSSHGMDTVKLENPAGLTSSHGMDTVKLENPAGLTGKSTDAPSQSFHPKSNACGAGPRQPPQRYFHSI
jgi:hypothetical protein